MERSGVADRIYARIGDRDTREVYKKWRADRDMFDRLPSPADLGLMPGDLEDRSCLLCVEGSEDPTFVFVRAGRALIERLGRDLIGETLSPADQLVFGSIGAAYRRALGGAAYFDYALFPGVVAGGRLLFERLILPLSGDGIGVTHLLGLITITETSSTPFDLQ